MDGYPKTPLLLKPVLFVVSRFVAPRMLQKALDTRVVKPNGPTVKESVPPPGGDPAAAVAEFRATVERYDGFAGLLLPSPVFGKLDRDTMTRLQVLHAEHHLSFLVPKA